MGKQSYDCIVIGVGGFGSGALYHLARRGVRVLGLERFRLGHDRGSSHGRTRIIRKAYFEHPDYVPLLLRAYALWEALEAEAGLRLLQRRGLVLAGSPGGKAVPGAKLSASCHDLPLEELTPAEARRRFPLLRFAEEFEVVVESDGGFLLVEECVRAHADLARRHGATVAVGETVRDWQADGRNVRVVTDRGRYTANALIITAGAWARSLVPELSLRVVRKLAFWFGVGGPEREAMRSTPVFFFELPYGTFYGIPAPDGRGVKVAEHTGGQSVGDPAELDRRAHPEDLEPVADFLGRVMPGVDPVPVAHSACMYTNSPDGHFIIDRHPRYDNVVLGAGFSGHGFKFTSVLGQALAELALDGRSALPIGFLSAGRLGTG